MFTNVLYHKTGLVLTFMRLFDILRCSCHRSTWNDIKSLIVCILYTLVFVTTSLPIKHDGGKEIFYIFYQNFCFQLLSYFKILQKKVKISGVKRSQHIKHKKNFARPGKKKDATKNSKSIEKQLAASKKVFGKPIGQNAAKRKESKGESVQNGKGKKSKSPAHSEKPATNGHSVVSNEDEMDEEDIRDLMEMIEDEDDELLNRSKKRKKDDKDQVDDDNAGQFEQEYAFQRNEEKSKKTRTVDLLPIKTKSGELITRQTEVEIKDKPKVVDEEEGDESEHEEVVDSDDDIVNDLQSEQQELIAAAKDKAISTADLLILREQELNRQKYRIGIICSGILEKPEDKMKNFNALFELMDERHNDAPNLFSVRKIATMSLLEVFKDILPEYRIGQIDLKTQKGNFENDFLSINLSKILYYSFFVVLSLFNSEKDDNGACYIRGCITDALQKILTKTGKVNKWHIEGSTQNVARISKNG